MNIIETVIDFFKPFMDGEKKPLNVLETGNLWLYLTICNQTLRSEEVLYNNAQDEKLRQILLDAKKIHKTAADEISKMLKEEGVQLPKDTPVKPLGEYNNIPDAAKLNDEEIANLISFNLIIGITYATRGMTEALRADIGQIYFKVITKKTGLGLTLKQLMAERGWLRIAPPCKT